jgi:flagellar biosynthesis protein FlhB
MILLCAILTIVYHIYQALNIMLTIIHKYSINNSNNNNNNNNNMSIIRKYSINIMCYLILILSTIFIYRIHKDITTYLVLSVGMLYYMSGFVVCKQKRTRTKK